MLHHSKWLQINYYLVGNYVWLSIQATRKHICLSKYKQIIVSNRNRKQRETKTMKFSYFQKIATLFP